MKGFYLVIISGFLFVSCFGLVRRLSPNEKIDSFDIQDKKEPILFTILKTGMDHKYHC